MFGRLRAIGIVTVFLLMGVIFWGLLSGSREEPSTGPSKQVNLKGNSVPVFEFDEASSRSARRESTAAENPDGGSRKSFERDSGNETLSGTVVSALDGKVITEFKLLLVVGEYSFAMEDDFRFHYPTRGTFDIKRPETDQPMTLHVRAPGYLESIVPVDAGEEETADELLVRLESEYIVSGRVIDQNGVAIEGALIFDTRIPTEEPKQRALAIARSDKEGEFILAGLRTNEITLCAYRKGLSADLRVVPLEHHNTKVELVLRQGGVITGQATLDGAPVWVSMLYGNIYAKAQGQLGGENSRDIGRVDIGSRPDQSGKYRIEGIPGGQGFIQASVIVGDTMRDMYADIEVVPGITTRVDFPFRSSSSSVEGYLVAGQGFANPTQLKLSLDTGDYVQTITVPSEENGYYKFSDLPAGRVMLSMFSSEHVKFAMGDLAENETLRLDLKLDEGTDLYCTVNNVREEQVVFAILVPAVVAIPNRVDRMQYTRLSRSSSGKAVIEDGIAKFRRVDKGSYTVLVVSHSYGLDHEIDYESMELATRPVVIDGQEEIAIEVSF